MNCPERFGQNRRINLSLLIAGYFNKTMPYHIEYKDRYVSILEKEDRRKHESSDNLWAELAAVCEANGCDLVLSEVELCPSTMTFSDTFDSAVKAAVELLSIKLAICVNENSATENVRFFQTVASNRGVNVELFSRREDALSWLQVADQPGIE